MPDPNSSPGQAGGNDSEKAPASELPQIIGDAMEKTKDLPVVSEWVQVMLVPLRFFDNLPADPDLSKPLTFLGGVTGVAAIGATLYSLLAGHAASAITSLFYAVFIWGAAPFAAAGVIKFLGKFYGGSGTYKQSLVAVIYAQAPVVLSSIPIINFVALLYGLFLLGLAVSRSQKLPSGKAAIIVVILGAAMFVVFMASFFTTFGTLISHPGS